MRRRSFKSPHKNRCFSATFACVRGKLLRQGDGRFMNAAPVMETPACPLCGHRHHAARYHWPDQTCAVVCCRECQFFFLSPRPTEAAMRALYSRDHYYAGDPEGGYDDYAAQEDPLRRTFRRLLQTLHKRKLTGGRLLEVGCGYGYLLDEARPYFAYRVGTDFSQKAVQQATRFADRVVQGDTDTLPKTELFDTVISNHVIEHVYDPVGFLRKLREQLTAKGTLVISTPDMGAFWRLLMGRHWPSFKLPEHVLYFDRPHLAAAMSAAGLRVIDTIPYPHAFPIPLIAAKLKLPIPRVLAKRSLWLPRTTLAMAAVRDDGSSAAAQTKRA